MRTKVAIPMAVDHANTSKLIVLGLFLVILHSSDGFVNLSRKYWALNLLACGRDHPVALFPKEGAN